MKNPLCISSLLCLAFLFCGCPNLRTTGGPIVGTAGSGSKPSVESVIPEKAWKGGTHEHELTIVGFRTRPPDQSEEYKSEVAKLDASGLRGKVYESALSAIKEGFKSQRVADSTAYGGGSAVLRSNDPDAFYSAVNDITGASSKPAKMANKAETKTVEINTWERREAELLLDRANRDAEALRSQLASRQNLLEQERAARRQAEQDAFRANNRPRFEPVPLPSEPEPVVKDSFTAGIRGIMLTDAFQDPTFIERRGGDDIRELKALGFDTIVSTIALQLDCPKSDFDRDHIVAGRIGRQVADTPVKNIQYLQGQGFRNIVILSNPWAERECFGSEATFYNNIQLEIEKAVVDDLVRKVNPHGVMLGLEPSLNGAIPFYTKLANYIRSTGYKGLILHNGIGAARKDIPGTLSAHSINKKEEWETSGTDIRNSDGMPDATVELLNRPGEFGTIIWSTELDGTPNNDDLPLGECCPICDSCEPPVEIPTPEGPTEICPDCGASKQFLWKPISEKTGGLAVLLPSSSNVTELKIVAENNFWDNSLSKIQKQYKGSYNGRTNGDRPTFYFKDASGNGIPGCLWGPSVRVLYGIGGVNIPTSCDRFEKDY